MNDNESAMHGAVRYVMFICYYSVVSFIYSVVCLILMYFNILGKDGFGVNNLNLYFIIGLFILSIYYIIKYKNAIFSIKRKGDEILIVFLRLGLLLTYKNGKCVNISIGTYNMKKALMEFLKKICKDESH